MKLTAKTMFINVAVAGGLLLLGQLAAAQEPVPIPDPIVTPETDLMPPAAESIPPVDAAEPEGLPADGIVVEGDEVPWEGMHEGEPIYDVPSAGFPTPAICEVCGEGEDAPPLWGIAQDVRVLSLGRPKGINTSLTRLVDPNDPTVPNAEFAPVNFVLSTRNLSFDVAAGYSTTIARHLGRDAENRDHFLEFTYWGMQKWDAFRQANATDSLPDNLDPPPTGNLRFGNLYSSFPSEVRGFNRALQHWALQESRLNSFEMNIRLRPRSRADRMVLHPNGQWLRQCQPGAKISYLFGVRVLTFDESFRFHSKGATRVLDTDGTVLQTLPFSGDYRIKTHNDMLGLQIGMDYIFRECKWNWGFYGKTGPYINFADQISRIATDGAGDLFGTVDPDRSTAADSDDVSMLVEVGVKGAYKIRPNLSVRASYDLMWLVSVARAAEQLDFSLNRIPRVNNDSVIFTHGLSLGLECLW